MKPPPCTNCGKVHNRKRVPCHHVDVLKHNSSRPILTQDEYIRRREEER